MPGVSKISRLIRFYEKTTIGIFRIRKTNYDVISADWGNARPRRPVYKCDRHRLRFERWAAEHVAAALEARSGRRVATSGLQPDYRCRAVGVRPLEKNLKLRPMENGSGRRIP